MPPSMWKFVGRVFPLIASGDVYEAEIEFNFGKSKLAVESGNISVEFIGEHASFDDLFYAVDSAIKTFLSPQALRTKYSFYVFWSEWSEVPLVANARPVKGKISNFDPTRVTLPSGFLQQAIADGMLWNELFEFNPFLKRAVSDFNYALQQPLQEVPIYLYRAIESAQWSFKGEKNMSKALEAESDIKFVKRIANNAEQGLHTRHAAKTSDVRLLNRDEVIEAIEASSRILQRFHLHVANEMGALEGNRK